MPAACTSGNFLTWFAYLYYCGVFDGTGQCIGAQFLRFRMGCALFFVFPQINERFDYKALTEELQSTLDATASEQYLVEVTLLRAEEERDKLQVRWEVGCSCKGLSRGVLYLFESTRALRLEGQDFVLTALPLPLEHCIVCMASSR